MTNQDFSRFSPSNVQSAIDKVCRRLGICIDNELLLDYQNGHHPTLLSYEKVESSAIKLPAIQKYLMGAQTFCDHSKHLVHFYDISRATRHCIFIQKLNEALEICDAKVEGTDWKIPKLISQEDYDPFDALMFELVTASKYASLESAKRVQFIEETQEETPDFLVELVGKPYAHFVECKRFDRNADIFLGIRDRVKNIGEDIFKILYAKGISAIIDLEFYCHPNDISSAAVAKQCLTSLQKKAYVRGSQIATKIEILPNRKLDEYQLFPSPKYYWERYGYRPQGKWTAMTHAMICQPADLISKDYKKLPGRSTWLNEVDWECAIRWRICDENIQWKIRKLNYSRIFKGLDQLQSKSSFSTLHVWFEREGTDTIRQKELQDFFSRLSNSSRDFFSWIVFNETILETSPMGIPDIIEHAHYLTCSIAPQKDPFVSLVFLKELPDDELGEFGIGKKMPDIDDIFKKKGSI